MTGLAGDPYLMREAAAKFRLAANELIDAAGQIAAQAPQVTFVGPEGEEMRGGVAAGTATLRGAGERALGIADRLVREAAEIENQRALEALAQTNQQ